MATPPIPPSQPDRLSQNQGLTIGQSINSISGRVSLILQSDGNLVLISTLKPDWASGQHFGAFAVVMQTDGNLVLIDGNGNALWASGTYDYPGAFLIVQNDGHLVIYNTANESIWQVGR